MQIRYIGRKITKPDNVAGTGVTWYGHGDVQEVADPIAAQKLLEHPTIWQDAERAFDAGNEGVALPNGWRETILNGLREADVYTDDLANDPTAAVQALFTLAAELALDPEQSPRAAELIARGRAEALAEAQQSAGSMPDLSTMDDAALKALVRDSNLDARVDLRKKGDALRAAVAEALAAKDDAAKA